ncbi:MAG TPA: hypothetical protein VLB46_17425 [Pyrinomonadaceae bacterium]|nr:hypothetical protein [Pyrinomonadaceae bacterium]
MKKLVVIVVVIVSSCIGIRIASSSKSPKDTVQKEQQRQQSRQQKKERSRAVYRGLINSHSDKIPEIAATAKEDVRMEIEIGLLSFDPFAKPFNLQDFLKNAACDAGGFASKVGRRAPTARYIKAQGKREARRPGFYHKHPEQGLKGRNTQGITPFQGWNVLIVCYQGRRASRLPLAVIFRAVGAPFRLFQKFVPLPSQDHRQQRRSRWTYDSTTNASVPLPAQSQ